MIKMLLLVGLMLAVLVDARYYPESIDTLPKSPHSRVSVRGTVGPILPRHDKSISFRLVDEHGHSVSCILPPGQDHPRVGVEVIVSGVRNQFTVPTIGEAGRSPDRTVVEIDPVEAIEPVE